jgi:hypothetical protein
VYVVALDILSLTSIKRLTSMMESLILPIANPIDGVHDGVRAQVLSNYTLSFSLLNARPTHGWYLPIITVLYT